MTERFSGGDTRPLGNPAVSVVMPFFNGERFLAEAIDSVLSQSWRDMELILVDDGSVDGSRAIADRYAAVDSRVRVLSHLGNANLGVCAARNAGVRLANASRIAFIDADDRWPESGKLAEQMAIMDRHPSVGLLAGATRYWRSWDGGEDHVEPVGAVQDQVIHPPAALLSTYPLGGAEAPAPSSWVVSAAAIARVGGFEEVFRGDYGFYEDQAFMAKIYLHEPVYFSSRCWLDYRQHGASALTVGRNEGRYEKVRAFFLAWFDGYLAKQPSVDRRIMRRVLLARRRSAVSRARLGMKRLLKSMV